MTKILMVCLGNICRSPLAEAIMRSKLSDEQFMVDSAGTGNYHIGDLPDRRSVEIAHRYGLDITDQRGRQFSVRDFDAFDHIYVMDNSNYKNVIDLARTDQDVSKVKMILNEVYPGQDYDVPDPYHDSIDGFENVFKMLDEATDIIKEKLSLA